MSNFEHWQRQMWDKYANEHGHPLICFILEGEGDEEKIVGYYFTDQKGREIRHTAYNGADENTEVRT